jgi:hypothetical protein
MRIVEEYKALKRNNGPTEREILTRLVNTFRIPPYLGFPAFVDHAGRIRQFSPRMAPNRAMHGTDIGLPSHAT